jgi:hypothetical protein
MFAINRQKAKESIARLYLFSHPQIFLLCIGRKSLKEILYSSFTLRSFPESFFLFFSASSFFTSFVAIKIILCKKNFLYFCLFQIFIFFIRSAYALHMNEIHSSPNIEMMENYLFKSEVKGIFLKREIFLCQGW